MSNFVTSMKSGNLEINEVSVKVLFIRVCGSMGNEVCWHGNCNIMSWFFLSRRKRIDSNQGSAEPTFFWYGRE